MDAPGKGSRVIPTCLTALLVALTGSLITGDIARAQQAQINIDDPKGAFGGASLVGQPLGAANFSEGEPASVRPLAGRAGFSASHAPLSGVQGPSNNVMNPAQISFKPPVTQPADLPTYGSLEIPKDFGLALGEEGYGPGNGLTIDAAIEILKKENLDLLAARLEVPMSKADVLTASLRANPVFYADYQLVPYGHYSFLRPGGPQQSDVNVNIPLDVSFKRRARTASAVRALQVTEAQLLDATRLQIDNLYTVFIDVVAARLTLKFSRISREGLAKILADYENLLKRGEVPVQTVDAIRVQYEQSEIQVREAIQAVVAAQQALALMLNAPPETAAMGQVLDVFRNLDPLPETTEQLIGRALAARPDLQAMRFGLGRASADVRLARANAYPDVYLLYQPYTYINNQYVGVNPSYSYAVGLTANIPLFNRNQGNVRRANINVAQTQIQLKALERRVQQDVIDAVREFDLSRQALVDTESRIVPLSRRVRDSAERKFRQGEIPSYEFFQAERDFNDAVKLYRDALIRHRRAMLDLNTAVGQRLY